MGAGAGLAVTAAAPLATEAAAAETDADKKKARYQANSTDVQTYYASTVIRAEGDAAVLIKRTERQARRGNLAATLGNQTRPAVSIAAASCAGPASSPAVLRRSARCRLQACTRPKPAGPSAGRRVTIRKSICTHCSVGCTVTAEVSNGVWVGQEPSWDTPINRGSHCAKGASVRELVSGERRLKYPMKLVERPVDARVLGRGDQRDRRQADGRSARSRAPDSVYWLGSAKMTNEGAYLFRKLGAFWGTNNTDHQARICHSTTVTGVANTWGYGAMTNSYTDIRNSKTQIIMGGNPAEAHPVSLQHLLEGAELNKANVIVIDPRLTRTAAHATEYVRMRPGTDIPVLYGHDVAHHQERLGGQGIHRAARLRLGGRRARKSRSGRRRRSSASPAFPARSSSASPRCSRHEKPSTLIWCMGQTQHTVGTANVRASCIAAAAHRQRRRARHGRQHLPRPRQRAGRDRRRPRYRDAAVLLRPGRRRVEALVRASGRSTTTICSRRFDDKKIMETPGIPLDALVRCGAPAEGPGRAEGQRARRCSCRAMPATRITRIPESLKGLKKLELLVVADPHPTTWASLAVQAGRKDDMYLLPVAPSSSARARASRRTARCSGASRSSSRSSSRRTISRSCTCIAKKLGFADQMFKNIKVENNLPVAEDILREINRGSWSTGYCGQSPERSSRTWRNQDDFDMRHAAGHDGPEQGRLLRPAVAVLGLAGGQASRHAAALQHQPLRHGWRRHVPRPLRRRARGEAAGRHDRARSACSPTAPTRKDSEIKDGYPEFTLRRAQEARLGQGPDRGRDWR